MDFLFCLSCLELSIFQSEYLYHLELGLAVTENLPKSNLKQYENLFLSCVKVKVLSCCSAIHTLTFMIQDGSISTLSSNTQEGEKKGRRAHAFCLFKEGSHKLLHELPFISIPLNRT